MPSRERQVDVSSSLAYQVIQWLSFLSAALFVTGLLPSNPRFWGYFGLGYPEFLWVLIALLFAFFLPPALWSFSKAPKLLSHGPTRKIFFGLSLWAAIELLFLIARDFRGYVYKMHLVTVAFFAISHIAFRDAGIRRHALAGLLVGLLGTTLLSLLQAFIPGFFNEMSLGRSIGFHPTPNENAAAITMAYIVLIMHIPMQYRLAFTTFCTAGVFVTLTRTVGAAFTVSVLVLFSVGTLPIRPLRLTIPQLALHGTAVALFLFTAYIYSPSFNYMFNQQVVALGTSAKVLNTVSIDTASELPGSYSFNQRIAMMSEGFKVLYKKPFSVMESVTDAGNLAGHNAYLFYGLSYALPGLLLMPLLLAGTGSVYDPKVAWAFAAAIATLGIGWTDPLSAWTTVVFVAALLPLRPP